MSNHMKTRHGCNLFSAPACFRTCLRPGALNANHLSKTPRTRMHLCPSIRAQQSSRNVQCCSGEEMGLENWKRMGHFCLNVAGFHTSQSEGSGSAVVGDKTNVREFLMCHWSSLSGRFLSFFFLYNRLIIMTHTSVFCLCQEDDACKRVSQHSRTIKCCKSELFRWVYGSDLTLFLQDTKKKDSQGGKRILWGLHPTVRWTAAAGGPEVINEIWERKEDTNGGRCRFWRVSNTLDVPLLSAVHFLDVRTPTHCPVLLVRSVFLVWFIHAAFKLWNPFETMVVIGINKTEDHVLPFFYE